MAIARRQSNLKQAGYTATQTIAFSSATLSGSLLVCFACNGAFSGSTTVTNISDPVNGNWTKLGTDAQAAGTLLAVWYFANAGALTSAQNISIASGTGDQAIVIVEYTGVATSSPIDPATYGSTTGVASTNSSASLTNSLTTTLGTGDLYICGASINGNSTTATWSQSGGSNWNTVQASGDSTYEAIAVYDNLVSTNAPGTYSLTITTTDTANAEAGRFVAFQAAGGGGGAVTYPLSGSVTQAQALAIATQKAFGRTVSATQAQTLALGQQSRLTRAVAQAQGLTLRKGLALSRSLTQAQALSLARGIALVRALTQSQSLAITSTRVFLLTRSVTQSQTLALLKQAQLSRSVTQAQSLLLGKAVALARTIVQPQSLRVAQAVSRGVHLAQTQAAALVKMPRLMRVLGQPQAVALTVVGGHTYPFTGSISVTTTATLSYTMLVLPGPTGTAITSQPPGAGSATSNYQDWPVLVIRPGEPLPPVGTATRGL